MPEAKGELNVNSKQGRIEIKARMEKLTPATQFSPESFRFIFDQISFVSQSSACYTPNLRRYALGETPVCR